MGRPWLCRREKSATREAMTALAPFLASAPLKGASPVTEEGGLVTAAAGGDAATGAGEGSAGLPAAGAADKETEAGAAAEPAGGGKMPFSVAKLSCNGLVMLRSSQGGPFLPACWRSRAPHPFTLALMCLGARKTWQSDSGSSNPGNSW